VPGFQAAKYDVILHVNNNQINPHNTYQPTKHKYLQQIKPTLKFVSVRSKIMSVDRYSISFLTEKRRPPKQRKYIAAKVIHAFMQLKVTYRTLAASSIKASLEITFVLHQILHFLSPFRTFYWSSWSRIWSSSSFSCF
jgi:hypothetical protein